MSVANCCLAYCILNSLVLHSLHVLYNYANNIPPQRLSRHLRLGVGTTWRGQEECISNIQGDRWSIQGDGSWHTRIRRIWNLWNIIGRCSGDLPLQEYDKCVTTLFNSAGNPNLTGLVVPNLNTEFRYPTVEVFLTYLCYIHLHTRTKH